MERRIRCRLGLAAGVVLLVGCSRDPESPQLHVDSETQACIENLRRIHAGFVTYARERGALPETGGVKLLAALIADGVWDNTEENARRLTCPGVPLAELTLGGLEPTEWFSDPERVDGSYSAYAARDLAAHPLERFPAPAFDDGVRLVLAACDNHLGPNHDGVTNAVLVDGSVVTYELAKEIGAGHLPVDADRVPVGPDAPDGLSELRVLSLE